MKVLSPMSEEDAESRGHVRRLIEGRDSDDDGSGSDGSLPHNRSGNWRRNVEQSLVKMTAELAALREQIATGREWKTRKRRTVGAWVAWGLGWAVRQVATDAVLLVLVLLWLRKRKDRRVEDVVREYLHAVRERIRRVVPARS
jgi:hypothetical protein